MHCNDATNFFKKSVSVKGSEPIDLTEDATTYPQAASMADFDEEAYRHYLEGLDISDVQASEFMRIVWRIMLMWVEMDLPADSCGQIIRRVIIPPADEFDSLP